MTTEWEHLPNARHIDRVLADLSARTECWRVAGDTSRDATWAAATDAAQGAAQDAARDAAQGAAIDAAWTATWAAARAAARGAARGAAWYAAIDAVTALVAWDDCSELLDLPPYAVRLLAASDHYPAVLLYPAVLAFNTN